MISAPRDDLAGRTLGPFLVRERIGEGGFGAVYRAEQALLGREAVVKVLHTRLRTDDVVVSRFLREAQLASSLDHPYAAHVYAFGFEDDGLLWIAMELVRGRPLDRMLREGPPIPPAQMADLLDRLCEVIQTAHERGIIHRDLKPSNVMVIQRAGRLLPKLLDFGIAKLIGDGVEILQPSAAPSEAATDDTLTLAGSAPPAQAGTPTTGMPLTAAGAVLGSPPYMAPELWRSAGGADARADLYALGVLVYEALTGRRPFGGRTLGELQAAHLESPVPPLGGELPPALDVVLARALAKRPEDRFGSAMQLAGAFRAALGLEATRPVPDLEETLRDRLVLEAPRPLAQAVAALRAARNCHHARDAAVEIVATAHRTLAVLALACRIRAGPSGGEEAALRALRRLRAGEGDGETHLELARELCRPFAERPRLHPVPELVELFFAGEQGALLGELRGGGGSDEQVREWLGEKLPAIARMLRSLDFLSTYPVVVGDEEGHESWMGALGQRRVAILGAGGELHRPLLVDRGGRVVVSLWPLAQIARPAPNAPPELFLFDGKGRHGARLVSARAGLEHHDPELWGWLGNELRFDDDTPAAVRVDESPPYLGLTPFTPADAQHFVGREAEVEALVNRVRVEPLVVVVGPSGAGKSSLVQAGLVPALGASWHAVILRPGPTPMATLKARVEASDRLLLVVDQLEELFTLCHDAAERNLFAETLIGLAGRGRVVMTLRDDFLARADALPALRGRLSPALHLVGTPSRSDLLRILTVPLERAGYTFDEPDIPARMVDTVAELPAALPLLSFTARALWDVRDRQFRRLTLQAYDGLGGVAGALAGHAERTLASMGVEERRLAREALRHLVSAEGTRAVLSRTELRQLLGQDAVVERLIAARLLVAAEGERVELVHEALLTAWPRLVTWRREDAEGARMRDELRAAARQWEARARPRGLLWRHEALAEVQAWRSRTAPRLTDVESQFVDESARDKARGRRRGGAAIASVVALLVAVVVVLLVMNRRTGVQRQRAEAAAQAVSRQLAEQYQELGRTALLGGSAARALVYLLEAERHGAAGAGIDYLLERASRPLEAEERSFDAHTDKVRAVAFSADGSALLTAAEDGTARLWDPRTGAALRTFQAGFPLHDARFDARGERILAYGNGRKVLVWDARTGALVHELVHDQAVRSAAFSPDGERVLAANGRRATFWDLATGGALANLEGHSDTVLHVGFAPGGRLLTAAQDNTARVFAGDGRPLVTLGGHDDLVRWVGATPDGRTLITASWDGKAKIWDAETGAPLRTLEGHTDRIQTAAIGPDGTLLATAGRDGTARVWRIADGRLVATMKGHGGALHSVAFDPQGVELVTASADGTARVWEARSGFPLAVLEGHGAPVMAAVFAPASGEVATASLDGTAKLWGTSAGVLRTSLLGHGGWVSAVALSPDGTRVATASYDRTARVWDSRDGRLISVLRGHAKELIDARFLTGGMVVTAADEPGLRVWDGETGKLVHELLGHAAAVNWIDVDAAGERVVSGDFAGTAIVWDVRSGVRLATLPGTSGLEATAFSPDGTMILTAGHDGVARLWRASDGAPLRTMAGHAKAISDATFSADGKTIVTAGQDRIAILWDSASGAQRQVLRGHRGAILTARISHDGRQVVTAGEEGIGMVWSSESGALLGTLDGHASQVFATQYTADDQLIVTIGDDRGVYLWDAHAYRLLGRYEGHTSLVLGLAVGKDVLVTGGGDSTARIWDLRVRPPDPTRPAWLARCRVPFEIRDGRLLPRGTDAARPCLAR